ncbi:hypothetical protein D3C76_1346880 [compost metagenome]
MNLRELKSIVDSTIEHLHQKNPEEISVLITLSESSMGARASSGLKYAGLGFDWESGQFRLEPIKQLVNKGNSLQDVKNAVCRKHDGRSSFFCPQCGEKVAKDDRYCRCCSQQLN